MLTKRQYKKEFREKFSSWVCDSDTYNRPIMFLFSFAEVSPKLVYGKESNRIHDIASSWGGDTHHKDF